MRLAWVWLEQDLETSDIDSREMAIALNADFDPESAAALVPTFNQEQLNIKGLSDGAVTATLKDSQHHAGAFGMPAPGAESAGLPAAAAEPKGHEDGAGGKGNGKGRGKGKKGKGKGKGKKGENGKGNDGQEKALEPIDLAKKFQTSLAKSRDAAGNLKMKMHGRNFPHETIENLNKMQEELNQCALDIQTLIASECTDPREFQNQMQKAEECKKKHMQQYEMAKGSYDALMRANQKSKKVAEEEEEDEAPEDEDDQAS